MISVAIKRLTVDSHCAGVGSVALRMLIQDLRP
jgi:hypothetical protein